MAVDNAQITRKIQHLKQLTKFLGLQPQTIINVKQRMYTYMSDRFYDTEHFDQDVNFPWRLKNEMCIFLAKALYSRNKNDCFKKLFIWVQYRMGFTKWRRGKSMHRKQHYFNRSKKELFVPFNRQNIYFLLREIEQNNSGEK